MAVVWPSKNNFANGDVLTATNMNNIGDTLNVFNPTSATNGQVWVANGSGSGSYSTPASGMTLLTSGSLAGINGVTLSSISGAYQHLQLNVFEAYTSVVGNVLVVNPNSSASGAQGVGYYVFGDATTTAVTEASTAANPGNIPSLTYVPTDSTRRAYWSYTYLDYANTTNTRKVIQSTSLGVKTTTGNIIAQGSAVGTVTISAAITSLQLSTLGGTNFTAGTYELWGIK